MGLLSGLRLAPVQTSAPETQLLQFLYGSVVNLSHFSAAEGFFFF